MGSGTVVWIHLKGKYDPDWATIDLRDFDMYGKHSPLVITSAFDGYIVYDKYEDASEAVNGDQNRVVYDSNKNLFVMSTRLSPQVGSTFK